MINIFNRRFTSGSAEDVNFYFEVDDFAVSDNHRMAYWFFGRKATVGSTLVNVDAHTDCSYFWDDDRDQLRNMDTNCTVETFVNHRYQRYGCETPPVRYGNWVPALLDMYPQLFQRVHLCCHRSLTGPARSDFSCINEVDEEYLISFGNHGEPAPCLSIDVDYYFTTNGNVYLLRQTNPRPVEHFQQLLLATQTDPCMPLFVSLSPHCCGGWHQVLPFVDCIDRTRGLNLACEIRRCLEPHTAPLPSEGASSEGR